jgi:hypothetical protein
MVSSTVYVDACVYEALCWECLPRDGYGGIQHLAGHVTGLLTSRMFLQLQRFELVLSAGKHGYMVLQ